jgi:hypothetical protein
MDTCIFGPGEHKTDCYMRIVHIMFPVINNNKKSSGKWTHVFLVQVSIKQIVI